MHLLTSELMITPFPFVTRMSSLAPAIMFRLASFETDAPVLVLPVADRIAAP